MKGYVYVLTNPAMPGLVKIGRSKHAAAGRANAMYRGDTGVPLPFDIHFECMFNDCVTAESDAHDELAEHRINPNREFFRMDAEDAAMVVMRIRAYDADCTVVEGDYTVCEADMALVAHKHKLCPPEPYIILHHISDEAWAEAVKKHRARQSNSELVNSRLRLVVGEDGSRPIVTCYGCGEDVDIYSMREDGFNYCQECWEYSEVLASKTEEK